MANARARKAHVLMDGEPSGLGGRAERMFEKLSSVAVQNRKEKWVPKERLELAECLSRAVKMAATSKTYDGVPVFPGSSTL